MGCFASKELGYGVKEKEQQQFMYCVVRVDQSRKGWHRSVGKLLKSIEVREGNMNKGDELIILSGKAVPTVMMRTLGKSKNRLKLEYFHYGQCSTFLFGPDRKKFQKPPPAPPKEESPPPAAIAGSETGYPLQTYLPARYPGNVGGYHPGNLEEFHRMMAYVIQQ